MKGPHADAVRASIAAHDPANRIEASAATSTLPTSVEAPAVDSPPVDGAQTWLDAAPRKENDL
jgi:hypothetical protein